MNILIKLSISCTHDPEHLGFTNKMFITPGFWSTRAISLIKNLKTVKLQVLVLCSRSPCQQIYDPVTTNICNRPLSNAPIEIREGQCFTQHGAENS